MENRSHYINHLEKIKAFEDREKTVDSVRASAVIGTKIPMTMSAIKKNRRPITVEELDTDNTEPQNDVAKFFRKKKKFPLTQRDERSVSVGVQKLKDLSFRNKTTGINNPEDLDFLLWDKEPKELVTSVDFAQMLNFRGMSDVIEVNMTTILQDSTNSANLITFKRELSYPLYAEAAYTVRMIPSSLAKSAPHGNMVKLINQGTHAHGLTESMGAKAVGVEVGLMTSGSATKMNAIRNQPVDMRSMAIKAVMLKNQLAMAYGLSDDARMFEVREVSTKVQVLSTSQALEHYPATDVIIDITSLSDIQRKLLLALLTNWPIQKLVNNDNSDVYSMVSFDAENFLLYVSQGEEFEIVVEGIDDAPREYWSQCVQLFMNLGGLDDLVEVVRDTRGLAPILTYNASQSRRPIIVVSPYPISKCYHGLMVASTPNLRYIAPTILESSTLVLLVDFMMLSVYLNNVLHLSEQLGFGSSTLYPVALRNMNLRINDALMCYNFRSNNYQSSAMSLTCPWLANIDRFANAAVIVLSDISNLVRNQKSLDLIYCPIGFKMTVPSPVSSHALVTGAQEVNLSKIMGFESTRDATGDLVKLISWYRAISGTKLPLYGVSLKGLKLRGDEMAGLQKLVKHAGNYSIRNIMAVTEYEPQRIAGNSIRHTFFHNPGYIQAEADVKTKGHVSKPKTNSFAVGKDKNITGLDTFSTNLLVDEFEKFLSGENRNGLADRIHSILHKHAEAEDVVKVTPLGKPTSPPKEPTPHGQAGTVTIPGTAKVHVEGITGNCGITALNAVVPEIGQADGLSKLGLTVEDQAWLNSDELAIIANAFGYDLYVISESANAYNMHYTSAGGPRKLAIIYDTEGHFVPSKIVPGTTQELRTLQVTVNPYDMDDKRVNEERERILSAQGSRTKAAAWSKNT